MKAFQYVTAATISSAPDLLGPTGSYLAGGNDLLGLMKESIAEPTTLVNIKALPGLDKVETDSERWTLGTNVTVAQIEEHKGIQVALPALHQAAREVGSLQIRNVATLGGNLAQHSRCWYYRHRDVFCLKRGGDTCFARHGENRYHSLFTGNPCISPIVSNLSVALAALDATVLVQRQGKPTRLSIAELYAKAWDNPTAHHSLNPGDLILQVEISQKSQRSVYRQISERAAFDWALVSCAAAGRLREGRISQGRVVLGVVAPVPYQVPEANQMLEGQILDETLAGQVADRLLQGATPVTDNGYKLPMARTLIQRTLLALKD
jgi:xanthine dehydrogenase YagS FAD-binding subunit